jgi:putative oxidoreductase
LFEYEYHVPVLSHQVAAVLGTGAELILPCFVLLGLGGRLPTCLLFVFNAVAVVSYSALWAPDGLNGLYDHYYWGLLLLVVWLSGSGPVSMDHLIARCRFFRFNRLK